MHDILGLQASLKASKCTGLIRKFNSVRLVAKDKCLAIPSVFNISCYFTQLTCSALINLYIAQNSYHRTQWEEFGRAVRQRNSITLCSLPRSREFLLKNLLSVYPPPRSGWCKRPGSLSNTKRRQYFCLPHQITTNKCHYYNFYVEPSTTAPPVVLQKK